MERGARTLLFILVAALLVGALVTAVIPAYRQTAVALWRGQPQKSPIWESNQAYYTEVQLGAQETK
jgi:hypothetical protein